jgi:hypothetical protein
MNHTETYSQDLILLDHVSPVDVAHEDITSCALVRLMGQTRGLVRCGVTSALVVLNGLTRLMKESRQPP